MKVLLLKNFVSLEDCAQMNAWVNLGVENKWLDAATNQSPNWSYRGRLTTRRYGDRFDYPDIVYEVFNRITRVLGLHDLPKSVFGGGKNGVIVSCTLPGGNLYTHKDPMEGDLHVLRCNVMTQAADDGAELFIGGKKIDIGVGDLHCYLPSDVEHYVTQAGGSTPRIMWMFGYQASKDRFLNCQASLLGRSESATLSHQLA
jgi:hypothetical protein